MKRNPKGKQKTKLRGTPQDPAEAGSYSEDDSPEGVEQVKVCSAVPLHDRRVFTVCVYVYTDEGWKSQKQLSGPVAKKEKTLVSSIIQSSH